MISMLGTLRHALRRTRSAFAATPRSSIAGITALVALLSSTAAIAQGPPAHYLHNSQMPPGMIGQTQLLRGGPLPGYFQPVRVRAPEGIKVALARNGFFENPTETPIEAGMLIGQVYRLRVVNIPLREGEEVFPTIEVIDRLYPPLGMEQRFSIVIDLSLDDIKLALAGRFVTRVIYLEDPRTAVPMEEGDETHWIDAGVGVDALRLADTLGRPVAILRMGGRLPANPDQPDIAFLNGCPPLQRYRTAPEPVEAPMTRLGPPVRQPAAKRNILPAFMQAPQRNAKNTARAISATYASPTNASSATNASNATSATSATSLKNSRRTGP